MHRYSNRLNPPRCSLDSYCDAKSRRDYSYARISGDRKRKIVAAAKGVTRFRLGGRSRREGGEHTARPLGASNDPRRLDERVVRVWGFTADRVEGVGRHGCFRVCRGGEHELGGATVKFILCLVPSIACSGLVLFILLIYHNERQNGHPIVDHPPLDRRVGTV